MTEGEKQLIFDIKAKIKKCFLHCDSLKVEKENIEKQNEILKREISRLKESVTDFERKYEVLKMAKSLSDVEADPQVAKQKVTKIVREIDKCIALLNR